MSTTTTYTGVRIVDMPDLGAVTDSSSVVGEHAGSGRFAAVALRNYVKAALPYVSVQDYGAVGDGVTNDDAAILAAYNAAKARCCPLYFPGTANFYRVTSTLAITGPISIYGDLNNSTIKTTSGTADVITITGTNVLIEGLRFGSTAARTNGSYVNTPTTAYNIRISRCYFEAAWVGITIAATTPVCSTIDIEDCFFYNCVTNGIGILIQGGFEIRLRHIIMNSGATPQPLAGVMINACGDVTLQDVNVISHQDCMALIAGTGQEIDSVWATDSYFDTSSDTGLKAGTSGSGTINRCRFIGCWFSSHTHQGVLVSGGVDGMEFIDCHAFANGTGGFYLTGGTNFTLIGCQAAGNGGAAVDVGSGAENLTLIGNALCPVAGFGANTHGIFFTGAYSGVMVVSGNKLMGNSTAAIAGPTPASFILNPSQIIRDNPGFVDHASGSAAFPTGVFSVTVNHGLSGTPSLAGVLLTMRSGLGGIPGLYVSAVTATTFTVASGGVGPVADLAFTWQARL